MIRRPPRSTRVRSSAASDVYKRQIHRWIEVEPRSAATLGVLVKSFTAAYVVAAMPVIAVVATIVDNPTIPSRRQAFFMERTFGLPRIRIGFRRDLEGPRASRVETVGLT